MSEHADALAKVVADVCEARFGMGCCFRDDSENALAPEHARKSFTEDAEALVGALARPEHAPGTFALDAQCPRCHHQSLIGFSLFTDEGKHNHTVYRCTHWVTVMPVEHRRLNVKDDWGFPCGWEDSVVPIANRKG